MLSLFDALGLDPDNFTWEDLAACDGMETSWFFEDYEEDTVIARNVDQVCNRCPVQQSCALNAVESRQEGVRGGVYWSPTGKPDKARNKHKTEEDWKWLEQKIKMKLA